jgi:hypothetical protein
MTITRNVPEMIAGRGRGFSAVAAGAGPGKNCYPVAQSQVCMPNDLTQHAGWHSASMPRLVALRFVALRFLALPIGALLRSAVSGLAVCVLAAPAFVVGQTGVDAATRLCAPSALSATAKVDNTLFRSYQSNDGACLEAVRGGKVVFRSTGDVQSYTLGQQAGGNITSIPNGTDVTGRGRPDMIVSAWSGGAHCCSEHLVFELEPEFRLVATLDDADSDEAHFAHFKDKHYYYLTDDWTFAYWPSCFACSLSATVILRFVDDAHGGGFHLALDKMQKAAPTQAQWNSALRAAQKSAKAGDINSIGTTLWGPVLEFLYDGHPDLAWKFVDAVGPSAQQSPLPALADFCRLLAKSRYWRDLAPALGDAPPACSTCAPQK